MNLAGIIALFFMHYIIVLLQRADLKRRCRKLEEDLRGKERQVDEMRAQVARMPTHEEMIRECERFYDDTYGIRNRLGRW